MKIEIHIDNSELNDIRDHLLSQGIEVPILEIEDHMRDYIFGAIEDSGNERFEAVVESLLDLQD